MHGQDLSGIRQKLFEYLCGWLGGPSLYEEKYKTICMTTPHKGYAIGEKERDEWLLCMDKALETIEASDELKNMLKQPFFQIANAITNTRD
jgi:hemoglobin